MKLLLVQPKSEGTILGQVSSHGKAGLVRLSLPVVAALTPPDVDVRIVDSRVHEVNYDDPVDLVGISVLTPEAPDAYRMASHFRKRGTKVVLGGFHPTLMPEEAAQHADSIVVGEAEPVWKGLIDDLKRGELKPRYPDAGVARCTSGEQIARPRRDLLDPSLYYGFNVVQATRGCTQKCDFCSIHAFYPGFVKRPIDRVVDEVRELVALNKKRDLLVRFGLKKVHVSFADDSITSDRGHAIDLFNAIAPLGITWDCQVTARMGLDEELLSTAARSGCRGVSVGFETVADESLQSLRKLRTGGAGEQDQEDVFRDEIANFHKHGISVLGNFIFGFPWDSVEVFDNVLDLTRRIQVDAALFHVLTPQPGTAVRERLLAENRIATDDWGHYNCSDVVFVPDNMTPDDLQHGLLHVYREFYGLRRSVSRIFQRRRGWIGRLGMCGSMRRKLRGMQRRCSPAFGVWEKDMREHWVRYWRSKR